MTRGTRFRLFLILLLVFFIAAPSIIFWSQGYRLDLKSRAFVRVGGLFVKTIPRDANLVVEGIGTRRLRPPLLSDGYLLPNLIPGIYDITITKEGYFPWSKSLVISPLEVTKSTSVILFPEVPPIESLGNFSASDFWPAEPKFGAFYFTDPSGKRLFLWEKSRSKESSTLLLGETKGTVLGERIENVTRSPDGSTLLLKLATDYAIFNPSTLELRRMSENLRRLGAPVTKFERIFWNPAAKLQLIGIASQKRMYGIDLATATFRRILADSSIVGLDEGGMLILDDSGIVYRFSETKDVVEKIDELALPAQDRPPAETRVFRIQSIGPRQYLLLEASGNLWRLAPGDDPMLVSGNVTGFWPHPDGSRIALVTKDQVLSVYFLAEITGDIRYQKGELLKLGLVEKQPKHIYWLKDNWHVLLGFADRFEIVEIDSRFPLNRISYPISASRTLWDQASNTLVYLSQNTLWSLRLPI